MAERMVRPENSTSSTSTTMAPSTPRAGISVDSSARAGPSRRSSRYIVMSRDPTGTSVSAAAAIRRSEERRVGEEGGGWWGPGGEGRRRRLGEGVKVDENVSEETAR